MKEDVVSTIKGLARRLGRAVKSVDETPEGVEVYGTNGRTVYLDAETSGGRAVVVRAYESGGDEIRLADSAVRTDRPGWEDKVMRTMKEILGGREAAIAERVAVETAETAYKARLREVNHLLRDLLFRVGRHAKEFEGDSRNWGYVGDMGHVAENLRELDSFMSGAAGSR